LFSLHRLTSPFFQKVVNAKDFAIIQGLPGTGKTQTLAFITRLLAARGKRVLVTSYTHSAVDNVVLKLIEKGVNSAPEALSHIVRIANKSSCHKEVHSLLVSELACQLESDILSQDSVHGSNELSSCSSQSHTSSASSESLKKVISNARIVCCTALSVPRSPLLLDQKFDVVIVDEAGQISQPAILGALMSAEAFVLVGDHLQLPPLVTSEIAQSGGTYPFSPTSFGNRLVSYTYQLTNLIFVPTGFGISLLSRLTEKHPASVAPLTYQYRMNADICRLSSLAVYDGKLKCGTREVSTQILKLPNFPVGLPAKASQKCYGWLNSVIDPKRPAIFVDTDNIRREPRPMSQLGKNGDCDGIEALETKVGGKIGGNVVNPTEATLVRYLAMGLVRSGLNPASIGVISPFRAQVRVFLAS
jgi:DNA replication ATP-dependent helicase Dna2